MAAVALQIAVFKMPKAREDRYDTFDFFRVGPLSQLSPLPDATKQERDNWDNGPTLADA